MYFTFSPWCLTLYLSVYLYNINQNIGSWFAIWHVCWKRTGNFWVVIAWNYTVVVILQSKQIFSEVGRLRWMPPREFQIIAQHWLLKHRLPPVCGCVGGSGPSPSSRASRACRDMFCHTRACVATPRFSSFFRGSRPHYSNSLFCFFLGFHLWFNLLVSVMHMSARQGLPALLHSGFFSSPPELGNNSTGHHVAEWKHHFLPEAHSLASTCACRSMMPAPVVPGHALLQPCMPPLPDGAPIEDYTPAEIFHIISAKASSSQEVQVRLSLFSLLY